MRPWTRRELAYAAWSVALVALVASAVSTPQLGILGLSVGPVVLIGAWWGRRGRPAWQHFLAAILSSGVGLGCFLAACLQGIYLWGMPGFSEERWDAVLAIYPHLFDPDAPLQIWPALLKAGLALAFAEALLRLPPASHWVRWALATLAGGACFALALNLACDWAIYSKGDPEVWTTSLEARLRLAVDEVGYALLISSPVAGCLALAHGLTRAGFGPQERDPSADAADDDEPPANAPPSAEPSAAAPGRAAE